MTNLVSPIKYWENPQSGDIAETPEAFLLQLNTPSWLVIPGRDRNRSRVISTLLHGNEPSGLIAIHRWLKQPQKPATDIHFFIGSVSAALTPPLFSTRNLPEHRDLNRCFRPPFDAAEGILAEEVLNQLARIKPECVIDIHNTSGAGPSFCVTPIVTNKHLALVQIFSPRLVITELKLGALMEMTTEECPILTVECGGARDSNSHETAFRGLNQLVCQENVLTPNPNQVIEELLHPVRLELKNDTEITYDQSPQGDKDLTLTPCIENYNFGLLHPDQPLGWIGKKGLSIFSALDPDGVDISNKILREEKGQLFVKRTLKIFMATTHAEIAKSDCLFYFVLPEDRELVNAG